MARRRPPAPAEPAPAEPAPASGPRAAVAQGPAGAGGRRGRGPGVQGRAGQPRPALARPRQPPCAVQSRAAVINQSIIRAAESGQVRALLSTIEEHLPSMNVVNLSTSVYRLARLASGQQRLQAELQDCPVVCRLLRALDFSLRAVLAEDPALPQSVSNISWSLATLGLVQPHLLEVLASLAVANTQWFKPYELSSTLWAFAKLGAATDERCEGATNVLFQAAAEYLGAQLPNVQMRTLATVVWAFATCHIRNREFFKAVATEVCQGQAMQASSMEVSNTVWAFATAGHKHHQLMQVLGDAAVRELHSFKPQEVSNTLWGYATLGFYHPAFCEGAMRLLPRMNLRTQHMANIMWAIARGRPHSQEARAAVTGLVPRCRAAHRAFKPQEACSVLQAVCKVFGRQGAHEPAEADVPPAILELCDVLEQSMVLRLRSFTMSCLSSVLGSLTVLGHGHDRGALAIAVALEATHRAPKAPTLELVVMLKGLLLSHLAAPAALVRVASCLAGRCPLAPQCQSFLQHVLTEHQGSAAIPPELLQALSAGPRAPSPRRPGPVVATDGAEAAALGGCSGPTALPGRGCAPGQGPEAGEERRGAAGAGGCGAGAAADQREDTECAPEAPPGLEPRPEGAPPPAGQREGRGGERAAGAEEARRPCAEEAARESGGGACAPTAVPRAAEPASDSSAPRDTASGSGQEGTESGASEGKEYYQVGNTFVEAIENSCSHAGWRDTASGSGQEGTESGASEGKEYYQVRNTFVEAIESSCSHAGCGSGKACCSHAAQRPCGSEPPPAIGERGSRRREPLMRLARTPSRPCWPGPRAASDSSPDPPPRRG